jgi:hypothetical protein
VNVAPSCVGSREGSDHFESYIHSLSLHFCKRLFPRLEPMTSWSKGNNFTAVSGLPFNFMLHYLTKNILPSKHDMAEMLIMLPGLAANIGSAAVTSIAV